MIEVVGVPFNSAGSTGGRATAPAALRRAGLVERLGAVDRGDLDVGHPSPERDPASGLLAQSALTVMTRSVRSAVQESLRTGQFPLVVGGDCPVLLGALRGAQDIAGRTALLFVDGHEDAWPPWQSTTGEAADSELGFALGRHRTGLPADFVAELPELDPRDVVALGPRDADELAEYGVDPLPPALTLHRDDALIGDAATTISSAVVDEFIARRMPWWLHVDLDVLSTAAFPAVDYQQDGGLDWAELRQITANALRPGCLGMTVTIYNPDLDPAGTHAQAIVDYLAGVSVYPVATR